MLKMLPDVLGRFSVVVEPLFHNILGLTHPKASFGTSWRKNPIWVELIGYDLLSKLFGTKPAKKFPAVFAV